MISFESDYIQGAHPQIIGRLTATNLDENTGYSVDSHSQHARQLIRQACQAPQARVEFMMGGTQANLTIIAGILRPHQGVIAAGTGHVNTHEAGAIEATGHKVLVLDGGPEGKLRAADVAQYCQAHYADGAAEHIVQPGMVYVSQSTECGTVYTLRELQALRQVCDQYRLPLFLDGARLGYALAAADCDFGLPELAALVDVFYIGGTKVGALFGEAVVITNDQLLPDFRYLMKQRGGLLAKGWLLGLQFETLFTDGLYLQGAQHAVRQALRIRQALLDCGIELLAMSSTNQQFPIFTRPQLQKLTKDFKFTPWGTLPAENGQFMEATRITTSWATDPEDVDTLIAAIGAL